MAAKEVHNFEKFTNLDYQDLEDLDYRSQRYKKRHQKCDSKSDLSRENSAEES